MRRSVTLAMLVAGWAACSEPAQQDDAAQDAGAAYADTLLVGIEDDLVRLDGEAVALDSLQGKLGDRQRSADGGVLLLVDGSKASDEQIRRVMAAARGAGIANPVLQRQTLTDLGRTLRRR